MRKFTDLPLHTIKRTSTLAELKTTKVVGGGGGWGGGGGDGEVGGVGEDNSNSKTLFSTDCSLGSFSPV